jgi:DNA-binding CsgD family transcriptional regulator
MDRVATSRLMEATESLPPADRALVNLWVNRGLDAAALAELLGISEETIASRRARIVERLSVTLGLPPDHVRAALDEITFASTSENGDAAVAAPPVRETTAADTATEPEVVPTSPRRRRMRWWGLGLTALLIAVVVLVVSLASSGPGHRRHPTAAGGSTQTAPTSTGGSATSGSKSDVLSALPGGTGHASGSVTISPGLRLTLRVSDLAPASQGHYEIWLYNSVTNSVPLGRLRTGVDRLSLPLPRGADGYHWIDISFQPVGAVFHSGESLLRAANPLFGKAASSSS